MMNEEWTGGLKFIAGCCGNEWRRGKKKRERVAEFRSEILKCSLERTWVPSSDPLSG